MFSFINELIRKINTSLIQVFTASNLHKMPMTLCIFSEMTYLQTALQKIHEKKIAFQRILHLLGTLKSWNPVFHKMKALDPGGKVTKS